MWFLPTYMPKREANNINRVMPRIAQTKHNNTKNKRLRYNNNKTKKWVLIFRLATLCSQTFKIFSQDQWPTVALTLALEEYHWSFTFFVWKVQHWPQIDSKCPDCSSNATGSVGFAIDTTSWVILYKIIHRSPPWAPCSGNKMRWLFSEAFLGKVTAPLPPHRQLAWPKLFVKMLTHFCPL